MRCHEPELPAVDLNIDGAPAEHRDDEPGSSRRYRRFGPVFLDLGIRQLEIVRGSSCEDDGPIRYADNEVQGTRKLHIAVGNDGDSVVMLTSVAERFTQKLE